MRSSRQAYRRNLFAGKVRLPWPKDSAIVHVEGRQNLAHATSQHEVESTSIVIASLSEACQTAPNLFDGNARAIEDHAVQHCLASIEMARNRQHQEIGWRARQISNLPDAIGLALLDSIPCDTLVIAEFVRCAKFALCQPCQKTERGSPEKCVTVRGREVILSRDYRK